MVMNVSMSNEGIFSMRRNIVMAIATGFLCFGMLGCNSGKADSAAVETEVAKETADTAENVVDQVQDSVTEELEVVSSEWTPIIFSGAIDVDGLDKAAVDVTDGLVNDGKADSAGWVYHPVLLVAQHEGKDGPDKYLYLCQIEQPGYVSWDFVTVDTTVTVEDGSLLKNVHTIDVDDPNIASSFGELGDGWSFVGAGSAVDVSADEQAAIDDGLSEAVGGDVTGVPYGPMWKRHGDAEALNTVYCTIVSDDDKQIGVALVTVADTAEEGVVASSVKLLDMNSYTIE